MSLSSPATNAAIVAFGILFFTGCKPQAEVSTYTIPKSSAAKQPLDAEGVLEQFDHILVAIVPQGNKAWFFKLGGKAPAIERQREPFIEFLKSVKLADSSSDTPTWTLLSGWTEKGPSEMRAATLVVPDESGELELAVSSLPLTTDFEDFLIPNVNRWLGQLNRQRLSKQTILKLKEEKPISNGRATLFQLSGIMSQQPMGGNPHEGLGIGPPSDSQPTKTPSQPPSQSSSELVYQKPEAWLPGKASSMRQASFRLPGGSLSDEVAVTRFPDAPGTQMGDVAVNLQRWAVQVGLTQLTSQQLEEMAQPITISGIEGTYVEFTSPEDAANSVALFAAMVQKADQIWFFKMSGDSKIVAGQREAFRAFLTSVKLP